ncbi:low specificity L-threonine aldolase [Roseovarius sp. LXJ103]|uniref:threonine aldolase family protein n=1 Tax=Roseovarius carneus TaxID=2853164 RepID=UPI000D611948|nr:beta-eliminating lyase-related protein [Roseovarius carneus]MBZ8118113.1 low specificity L-threonine aldolase [Roseovarius carneus]PWE36148.1 low specificity L-threonine aldolase [Pelagicola sp. LXJ1103]
MYFYSDNCGPMHPNVRAALLAADEGFMPSYGNDPIMDEVRDQIRDLFGAPDAAVYLVATGTAANALGLATITKPWDTVFCTSLAHINVDECNAPEFYTGGAKLSLVGSGDKMTPEALEQRITGYGTGNVHTSQRGPVQITQVTEMGRLYTLGELRALTDVARAYGLPTFMDGARFANAMAALGCTAREMTVDAGIDALSFGGTKNGCAGVEAVVFFEPDHAWEFELRRKRGAHLVSKHRYLSAQMQGYLAEDTWLKAGAQANANAARLTAGLRGVVGLEFVEEPEANMIFATLPRHAHQTLKAGGAEYGLWGDLEGDPDERVMMRLVCDWSITHAMIDEFLDLARGLT